MLHVEGLQVAYGRIQALWGVSFDVQPGEVVALVGANGAGKTTTLKTLSGVLRPSAGSIVLEGERLEQRSTMDIVERGVIHVPEGRKLFPEMSVRDNLLLGGFARSARAHQRTRLEQVFTLFPRLRERQGQVAGTLSGGEQQMVAIGRGLMAGPRVLMLDEPSLGLAPIMVRGAAQGAAGPGCWGAAGSVRPLRQAPGGTPTHFLKARLKAASEA